MHKNSNGQQIETKWYYYGPDSDTYGPYLSKDMLFWLKGGYFNNDFQLRTENEQNFRTLGEWSQLLGTHPFSQPVHSFEASANQINASRSHGGPMMMMPPGLPPTFPPQQMPMRFPSFLPMPLLHQLNQNGGPPMGGQMHSQPPSEPIDAGSLSHTPDSENEFQGHLRKPLMSSTIHSMQQTMMARTNDAHTATEPVIMKNAECQTEPVELSKANASRLLSELFGQLVVIN
uniref:GYF domain-containing protein n=1 Tax=Caenorhabditis tropicalis TaxID=1561998 RepID=A0A1I7T2R9_9PELO